MKKFLAALCLLASTCWASPSYQTPYVDEQIDPAKSFWDNYVHYPYQVQYAKVPDRGGRSWEIAYLDVFAGDSTLRDKAPVLIMLHGRAMNSGYWGKLIQAPVEAGWRVVSIDWGLSGKTLARNLDKPINRSFDETRELLHTLIVKQLGIAKASYLGHSMGGQIAAGYALRYPESVQRLVLYAPGGLETVPANTLQFLRIDKPELLKDEKAVVALWKAGGWPSMGETREAVENSFFGRQRPGTLPYLPRADDLNNFIAASRAAILRGNPQEAERFKQAYAWDSMAAMIECRQEDADSLPNRISRLKTPTLLVMGLKDPAFPWPGTGNQQLVSDIVQPFYVMAKGRQAPVQIKLYENAGHFIHLEIPDEMNRDLMAFLQSGQAPGPLYAGNPEPYLPLAKKPMADLPSEIGEFKNNWEQGFLKHDLTALRQLLHPEIKHNGKNLEQLLAFYAPFIASVTRWEWVVFGVEKDQAELVLDVETRNDFGTHPDQVRLKQYDGQWKLLGNQR